MPPCLRAAPARPGPSRQPRYALDPALQGPPSADPFHLRFTILETSTPCDERNESRRRHPFVVGRIRHHGDGSKGRSGLGDVEMKYIAPVEPRQAVSAWAESVDAHDLGAIQIVELSGAEHGRIGNGSRRW